MSLETYAKNVRLKTTKCSLKTWFYWMLMDMCCLPKCDIYIGTIASNRFKSHTKLLIFFSKKRNVSQSNVRAEIHLVRCNIVFNGQSLRAFKKFYSGLTFAFDFIKITDSKVQKLFSVWLYSPISTDFLHFFNAMNCLFIFKNNLT